MIRCFINSGVFLIFFSLCAGMATAQSVSFEWVEQATMAGFNSSYFKAGAGDRDGNVYVTGEINGEATFRGQSGPIVLTRTFGAASAFLAKFDRDGTCLWAKFLSPAAGIGNSLIVDSAGYVYIAGAMTGPINYQVDGVPYTITTSGSDIFVCKTDKDGNFRWIKTIEGTGTSASTETGLAIAQDAAANIYVSGSFVGTADFNPDGTAVTHTTNPTTAADAYIMKLDSSGDFKWVKTFGGDKADAAAGLTTDRAGNVYATGDFSGTTDFSSGSNAPDATVTTPFANAANIYVLKLNTLGDFVWVKTMVSSAPHGSSKGQGIGIDVFGNVYTTGYFCGRVDFNPGTPTLNFQTSAINSRDIFISKLNASGDFVWAKRIGINNNEEEGRALVLDKDKNFYITGVFGKGGTGIVDFDPGTGTHNMTSNGGNDVFVLKMDTVGDFVWVNKMGGTAADEGNQIFVDGDYNLYTFGRYRTEAEFYFGTDSSVKLTSTSSNAAGFVHKVSQFFCTPTSASLSLTDCDSIIINGQKFTTGGSYTQTLVNAAGCDSILSLNLTINHSIIASSMNHTVCDSFEFNNQMHYASGPYVHVFSTSAGCDSTVTLNLTVNHSVHTVLTEDACESYVLDTATYWETGVYEHRFETADGCDSLVTLDLTILRTADTVTEATCFRFVDGVDTFTQSGLHTRTFTNIAGCDSLVTIDLTISDVDVSVIRSGIILTAGQAGGTYQWLDCDDNYKPLSGAMQQMFSPETNGNYSVAITWDGCTDTSACYEIAGITNSIWELDGGRLSVYPNPAHDILHIVSAGSPVTAVRLLGITGNVLMQRLNTSGEMATVDISRFAAGVYLLEVHTTESRSRITLVKE